MIGISRTKAWIPFSIAALAVAVGIAMLAGGALGSDPIDFDCENHMFIHGEPAVPGAKTGQAAYVEAVDALRSAKEPDPRIAMTDSDYQAALAALESTRGPSRFDENTGDLIVDDRLVARFGLTRLPDGSFAVTTIETCGPPPTSGATSASPSVSVQEGSST